jgi:hypothetical protein
MNLFLQLREGNNSAQRSRRLDTETTRGPEMFSVPSVIKWSVIPKIKDSVNSV